VLLFCCSNLEAFQNALSVPSERLSANDRGDHRNRGNHHLHPMDRSRPDERRSLRISRRRLEVISASYANDEAHRLVPAPSLNKRSSRYQWQGSTLSHRCPDKTGTLIKATWSHPEGRSRALNVLDLGLLFLAFWSSRRVFVSCRMN
jgi:hypothetical protein